MTHTMKMTKLIWVEKRFPFSQTQICLYIGKCGKQCHSISREITELKKKSTILEDNDP